MTRWQRRFELDDDKYPELYRFTEELKKSRQFAPFMLELLDIGCSIRRKNDVMPLLESTYLRDGNQGGAVLNDIRAALILLDMVERCDIESLFSAYPELMLETIRFMRVDHGQQPSTSHTPPTRPIASFKHVETSINDDELLENTFNALDDMFGD